MRVKAGSRTCDPNGFSCFECSKSGPHSRMGRRSLTDKERGRIHGLHEAGFSYRTIAARVRRSVSIVGRVLSTKKPSPPKPLGRPSALSERLVRRVVRRASEGGTSSTKLKAEFDLPCHARTVRRILADTDFLVFAKMEQTLDLTPEHKAKRIAFAKLRLGSGRVWNNVILSDEKKFNSDGPDGFKFFGRTSVVLPRHSISTRWGRKQDFFSPGQPWPFSDAPA